MFDGYEQFKQWPFRRPRWRWVLEYDTLLPTTNYIYDNITTVYDTFRWQ